MRSILSRLEALEARRPDPIVLAVKMADGTERQLSVSELAALPDDQRATADFHVISGGDLHDADMLLNLMMGNIADCAIK